MTASLPKSIVDAFSQSVRDDARDRAVGSGHRLYELGGRSLAMRWNGEEGVATRLDFAADGRTIRCFCTCGDASGLRHRCGHVYMLLQTLQIARPKLRGDGYRIASNAHAPVALCRPADDQAVAEAILELTRIVPHALELRLELLEPGAAPSPTQDFMVLRRDGGPGARGAGPAAPRQPTYLDRLDAEWQTALRHVESVPSRKRSQTRQRELVYRLHGAGDDDVFDRDLLVELVVASEAATTDDAGRRILSPGPVRASLSGSARTGLGAEDREIVMMIVGATERGWDDRGVCSIPREDARFVATRLVKTGRAVVADSTLWRGGRHWLLPAIREIPGATSPVVAASFDDGGPWRFVLELAVDPNRPKELLRLAPRLARAGVVRSLSGAELVLDDLVLWRCGMVEVDAGSGSAWRDLGDQGVPIPRRSTARFVEALARRTDLPEILVADEVAGSVGLVAAAAERRHLHVAPHPTKPRVVRATASLRSTGAGAPTLPVGGSARVAIGVLPPTLLRRDDALDAQALGELAEAGFTRTAALPEGEHRLAKRDFTRALAALAARGWTIEGEAGLLRVPGALRSSVRSGIDWFDLEGEVDFGGAAVSLATVLESIRERRSVVPIGDGTFGILPDEWLSRFGLLARGGVTDGAATRFRPAALLLVEAALGAEAVDRDEATARIRAGLRSFEGVEPRDPQESFVGELRPYQREGLGWLTALRGFGLGGCLADDMGLGKTIQVLALLDARRAEREQAGAGAEGPRASVVVAPRSLVHNWLREAERFVPQLRVVDASGTERSFERERLDECDVVVTTYGVMRSEIAAMREAEFDYVVLDEAQAIKNAASQTARAAKLLRSRHRLALSGTPVENHLGELWSLVEFLNPALFAAGGPTGRGDGEPGAIRTGDLADPALAAAAARVVRPFLLRRTKAQVAPQLPDRIEKTLLCRLEGAQRTLYARLRDEVRGSVLGTIDRVGVRRSGIAVLEGLLRLRQAACHPGLIDPSKSEEPAAKLESLLPTLEELAQEGHKTLVFSQFTSLLDLVEPRLERAGLRFERLDGSTRDREARVNRFIADPECPVFLISLKAGGLGLNLTAADHVVLLDPWWNPAVEAQAIDRAHRIGQHRTVVATRLIAEETVEQRILELQARKREIADAIVGEARGPLASMTREDIEELLR
ncbi:MAG TPA: DEAD/DEAH box helicase [Phycisphaerales bacterium]|nr:DEAD/DEAH box helicase [Phycisphaerales bacterium]HMP36723.1 DEAD/DEAH box helicase [Phycisphaerales bacterium]